MLITLKTSSHFLYLVKFYMGLFLSSYQFLTYFSTTGCFSFVSASCL